MAGVNRWYGVGNMTADPKVKKADEADRDRAEFSIAINNPGQDSEPTYLDCIAWGKLAGQVGDYGRKGRMVFVEGAVEVRKWETDEGERRKQFRIKAYTVRFLDKRERDESDDERPTAKSQRGSTADLDDLPF
jgi:single-strand DNA-binding protein